MAFAKPAEQRILEAMEAGEFDRLPNAGARLDLDSYFALPAHLRVAIALERMQADGRRRSIE